MKQQFRQLISFTEVSSLLLEHGLARLLLPHICRCGDEAAGIVPCECQEIKEFQNWPVTSSYGEQNTLNYGTSKGKS